MTLYILLPHIRNHTHTMNMITNMRKKDVQCTSNKNDKSLAERESKLYS